MKAREDGSVFVVEDKELVLPGLCKCFGRGLAQMYRSGDAAEALHRIERWKPALVVVDTDLAGNEAWFL